MTGLTARQWTKVANEVCEYDGAIKVAESGDAEHLFPKDEHVPGVGGLRRRIRERPELIVEACRVARRRKIGVFKEQ
ncbi:hypothetical protein Mal15_22240 [Stieleria maiorica]|uniref:Uncharacterized protein n=1 Tax=Stieleria maiorica TaxID=2795974 RepID=A0A5B9MD59_9BACT|nr:hypothetical protein Mal15_22240 [Stieleria maiorica]